MANIKAKKRGRQPNNPEPPKIRENTFTQPPKKATPDRTVTALRKYIQRYDLQIPTPMTLEGFMLRGKVGLHSESGKRKHRSAYSEASRAVNDHLRGGLIKEGDAIAEFLYAVNNRKAEFKLQFGENERRETAKGASPTEPNKPW